MRYKYLSATPLTTPSGLNTPYICTSFSSMMRAGRARLHILLQGESFDCCAFVAICNKLSMLVRYGMWRQLSLPSAELQSSCRIFSSFVCWCILCYSHTLLAPWQSIYAKAVRNGPSKVRSTLRRLCSTSRSRIPKCSTKPLHRSNGGVCWHIHVPPLRLPGPHDGSRPGTGHCTKWSQQQHDRDLHCNGLRLLTSRHRMDNVQSQRWSFQSCCNDWPQSVWTIALDTSFDFLADTAFGSNLCGGGM